MATRKILMQVNEMKDAEVTWLSLVKRGANRVPFRVTKNEGKLEAEMFDTSRMFLRKKEKPVDPCVAAFLIQKAESETLLPKLKDAGFNVEDLIEQDDVLVVKQDKNLTEADCTTVQLNEHMGAMLSNVQKAFTPYREDSSSFNENLTKHGFYPSVGVAMEALGETVRNVMYDADDVAEARDGLSEAMQQFAGYITTLVSNLPQEAFTAMKVAAENGAALKAEAEKSEKTPESGEAEKSDNAEADDAKSEAEKSEGADEDQGTEASKSDDSGEAGNEESSAAEKSETEDSGQKAEKAESDEAGAEEASDGDKGDAVKAEDDLAKKMDTILEAVSKLTGQVAEVSKSNSDLADRINEVDRVAKSAVEAVEGTVSAETAEDRGTQTGVRKSAQKGKDLWAGTGLDTLITL